MAMPAYLWLKDNGEPLQPERERGRFKSEGRQQE